VAELRLTTRPDAPYDAAAAADRLSVPSPPEGVVFPDPEALALLPAPGTSNAWNSFKVCRPRFARSTRNRIRFASP
jgi:hypothetical protein